MLFRKPYETDPKTGISFSEQEQIYANEVAVGTFGPQTKKIIDMDSKKLQGVFSYTYRDIMYDFSERILALAESRVQNDVELHFCYNCWIKLLYDVPEKKGYLERCIAYCKKDIKLWDKVRKDKFFSDKITQVPSFERLAWIYERKGEYEKAMEIYKLALSYKEVKDPMGRYKKSIAKLEYKIARNLK